jgi:L-fuculose-phosphate aldolase
MTTESKLRREIIAVCRRMNEMGINQGTSGNVSARVPGGMLVTPSAVPYERMRPQDIVRMRAGGEREAGKVPSTEWRFHLDILNARPDIGAVVHTHSMFATVLSIRGERIAAVHYMIAAAGGPFIRCAKYATYGTPALSRAALAALKNRNCCLLANHGVIAAGPNLAKALWLAKEVEVLAQQQVFAALLGGANILPDAEIRRVIKKFKDYGLKS